MRPWSVVGALLFALIVGCSVSPYQQAEKHISNREYREALQLYLRSLNPHVRDGRRYVAYEPEAMTGIGVVLWHMKRYDTAVKILQSVVKRTPGYGKALFYLGACHETQKRPDQARDAYAMVKGVGPNDPYRNALRWRLDWIGQQRHSVEVRRAMADEAAIALSSYPKESIAVLYFQNLSQDAKWGPLGKGLTDLVIADLSKVAALRVVDRSRLEKVLQETRFTPQELMDDANAVSLAKWLGVRMLVKGTFRIQSGNRLDVRAGSMYVPESKTLDYTRYSGGMDQLFAIEKQIVRKILADQGIVLSVEQERQISEPYTGSVRAFAAYSLGLDEMDKGNFKSAQVYFRQAVAADPLFAAAQSMQVPLDLYEATRAADAVDMLAKVSAVLGLTPGGVSVEIPDNRLFGVNATSRLQRLGAHMDAGFIPNNDTREAYNEVRYQDRGLPQPPGLPFIPERWLLPGPPPPPKRP